MEKNLWMAKKNNPKLSGQKPFKFLFTSFCSSLLEKLEPTTPKKAEKGRKEYLHDSFKGKKKKKKMGTERITKILCVCFQPYFFGGEGLFTAVLFQQYPVGNDPFVHCG